MGGVADGFVLAGAELGVVGEGAGEGGEPAEGFDDEGGAAFFEGEVVEGLADVPDDAALAEAEEFDEGGGEAAVVHPAHDDGGADLPGDAEEVQKGARGGFAGGHVEAEHGGAGGLEGGDVFAAGGEGEDGVVVVGEILDELGEHHFGAAGAEAAGDPEDGDLGRQASGLLHGGVQAGCLHCFGGAVEEVGEGEVLFDVLAAALGEGGAGFGGEVEELADGCGEGGGVAWGGEVAGVAEDEGGVADVGGDGGGAAGEGFAEDVGEAFTVGGGGDEGGEARVGVFGVGAGGVEGDGEVLGLGLEFGEVVGGAVADDLEADVGVGLVDEGGGADEGGVVLHGVEAADDAEHGVLRGEVGLGDEAGGVDAVGDDLKMGVVLGEAVVLVPAAAGFGVGDDLIGEGAEEAVEAEAGFAEEAPLVGVAFGVADAPDDFGETANRLHEERHEVGLGEEAVDEAGFEGAEGADESGDETEEVPAVFFAGGEVGDAGGFQIGGQGAAVEGDDGDVEAGVVEAFGEGDELALSAAETEVADEQDQRWKWSAHERAEAWGEGRGRVRASRRLPRRRAKRPGMRTQAATARQNQNCWASRRICEQGMKSQTGMRQKRPWRRLMAQRMVRPRRGPAKRRRPGRPMSSQTATNWLWGCHQAVPAPVP